MGRYDSLGDRARGYAEGVVDGYFACAAEIERLTGGLLTLKMPDDVVKWNLVVRELRKRKPPATKKEETDGAAETSAPTKEGKTD